MSLVGVARAAGTLHITWRAGRESEHLELLGWLRVHIRLYVAYLIAGGGFLLALAWVCSADHLNLIARSDNFAGKLALGVALFSTLALGGSAYLFHLLWREAIAYTQAGQDYSQRTTVSGVHRLHPRRGRRTQLSYHSAPSASDTTGNSRK